jgi:hypothetical protein
MVSPVLPIRLFKRTETQEKEVAFKGFERQEGNKTMTVNVMLFM